MSASASPSAIELHGVTVQRDGVPVLRGIDWRVDIGDRWVILGPNGSGKTTLLNIISGFYRPDEGSIRLGDDDLHGLSSHAIARLGVARTFQTPLIPAALTTAETVATGRYGQVRVSMLSSILRLPSFWRARSDDGAEAVRTLRMVGSVLHALNRRGFQRLIGFFQFFHAFVVNILCS